MSYLRKIENGEHAILVEIFTVHYVWVCVGGGGGQRSLSSDYSKLCDFNSSKVNSLHFLFFCIFIRDVKPFLFALHKQLQISLNPIVYTLHFISRIFKIK